MFLFYTPIDSDGIPMLIGDDLRHATKTLRKRVGDDISSTDGLGHRFHSRIKSLSKTTALLELISKEVIPELHPRLHIAIAMTKKSTRLEWFMEKCTEIGIHKITPLITSRTEKKYFKKERGDKILLAAMKQSMRFHKPELSEALSLQTLIKETIELDVDKFVGHYKPDNTQLSTSIKKGNDAIVLIGPEGDFSNAEISLIEQSGFASINLGNYRLRTETAGIVACHTFNMINNE